MRAFSGSSSDLMAKLLALAGSRTRTGFGLVRAWCAGAAMEVELVLVEVGPVAMVYFTLPVGEEVGEPEEVECAGEASEAVAEAVERVGAAETGAACRWGKSPAEVWSRLWKG